MAVLQASNLVKIYGGKGDAHSTTALNRISFEVEKGEFLGIMGASGSGKTTLLNILSGIDKPTDGYVRISKQKLHEMDRDELAVFRRQNIGFVFQEFNLLDSLSVKENIMLPMILNGNDDKSMEKRAEELMALFDIADIESKYPYHISGGQQQRTAVCRAIANHPSIVFADEPTGNLDSKASRGIMKCFGKMNEELGSTILVVTHDVFAASFCNRILFIKDGMLHSEIVKKDSKEGFLERIMDSLAVLGGENSDL